MCIGHPKNHPCFHTSVSYNHCVSAHFDSSTGVTTPCQNTTYAAYVDSVNRCTSQLCFFEELGGRWVCCQCGNGPNLKGWCAFNNPRTELNAITQRLEHIVRCDHCCCRNCAPCSFQDDDNDESGLGGPPDDGGPPKHNPHKRRHHRPSRHGGSSSQSYRWVEMEFSPAGHKSRRQK